jgi:PhnB protein
MTSKIEMGNGKGMQLMPYVAFGGKCEEAFNFYAKAVGGSVDFHRFGTSPMNVPEEAKNLVMHGTLTFGNATLFGSDGMPGKPAPTTGGNVSLSVSTPTAEEGAKVFAALAEGGTVTMPFAKQFWGDTFGMLVDKYGNAWMVNSHG